MDRTFRTLLFTKFNSVLKYADEGEEKKSVLLMPQPAALRVVSERRGSSELEFINYWRDEFIFDWDRNNTSAARSGLHFTSTTEESGYRTSKIITAVPLKLRYNIWYWTMYPDKLNKFIEDFIWWQHTNPNFNIVFDDTYELEIDMHFTSLKDESTADTQFSTGQYFSVNGTITLDTWLFNLEEYGGVAGDAGIIETIVLKIFDKKDLNTTEEYITVTVPEDDTYNEELHDALLLASNNITESV